MSFADTPIDRVPTQAGSPRLLKRDYPVMLA
jgi:hypothetical protein